MSTGVRTLLFVASHARSPTAFTSKVEHPDVGLDVRLLLFSQSGRYKRQGRMEGRPHFGLSGVFERESLQGSQGDT